MTLPNPVDAGPRRDLPWLLSRLRFWLTVAVLSDGDHFGEMALLTDAPRNATVRTLTPATLLALPRGQFLNLVGRSPGVRARVEATFARRQQELATLDAELWRAKKEPVRDVADLTVHPSVDALKGGVPT